MKKLIDCLKVGDKVWHILYGWGIRIEPLCDNGQILVQFPNFILDFLSDGKEQESDANPSLFLHEVKLEQELPEFVEGDIVLANLGIDSDSLWFVAKYDTSLGNSHTVFRSNHEGFTDTPLFVLYVKSFDKSHFQK